MSTGESYINMLHLGEKGNDDYSDDRLKYDEKIIPSASKSLMKLTPYEYVKKSYPDSSYEWERESGLIAQEVYYNAPELRHLVRVSRTAGDIDALTPVLGDDPNQDPDYSAWGDKPSGIKYIQFIPYLIKGIKEIVTELPRTRTTVANTWGQNITGLVVSANTNSHKTSTTPLVTLSNVAMDSAWYGVVSSQKTDTNDYDTLIDTKGDTQIWVTDVNGSLVSGDLVTTSNVAPGFAQKQSDDNLRSYTIAKVTQDCDFTEPLQISVKVPRRELSNVTYYVRTTTQPIPIEVFEEYDSKHTSVVSTPVYSREVQSGSDIYSVEYYYQGDTQISRRKYESLPEGEVKSVRYFVEHVPEEYEYLTAEEKAQITLTTKPEYRLHSRSYSTRPIPGYEAQVVQEMKDVLDDNGQIVWEETTNTSPTYTLRNYGNYKAALVSCKLI